MVGTMSGKTFAWITVLATPLVAVAINLEQQASTPAISSIVFWILLVCAAELLPVSLGHGTEVTMAFPIYLALAIVFRDSIWTAMFVAFVGALDLRELRREIPLYQSLFNRSQQALAIAATAGVLSINPASDFFSPLGGVFLVLAALAEILTNFSLVAAAVHFRDKQPFRTVIYQLVPKPLVGFVISYGLLGGLGVITAYAYDQKGGFGGGFAVAAILIPLLFARLSIIGARAQQELSVKVQQQQKALLEATQRVLQEREDERHRIAAEMHDSSLQMLVAASYGAENAAELLSRGDPETARDTMSTVRNALSEAITGVRASLVDLRRSSVERGGLVDTLQQFVEQTTTLWGRQVEVATELEIEPPVPVALAAFQIVQEGVVNALKHAPDGSIRVEVKNNGDGMIHIVVSDEGPGFDSAGDPGEEHHGLRLMRERAAGVGGDIRWHTIPGSGTRLEAVLPGGAFSGAM